MAKKTKKDYPAYPAWKAALWRLARVFLAGFLASVAIDQLILGSQDIQVSLLKAGLAGGIAAIAKYLRDEKPEELKKMPL